MDDLNSITPVAIALRLPIGHQELDPTPDTSSMFPTEVYERIIDFLAYEALLEEDPSDPHHIASCCLTSQSWFPRSRFHLYFQVTLGSRSRFEKFVRSLEISPRNSGYVKRLCISPSEDDGWVSTFPLVFGSKLKNLSTLTCENLNLTSVHPRFFQHLSTFSAVTELRLVLSEFPGLLLLRMISAFPRLQKLTSEIFPSPCDETATLVLARRKRPLPLRHLYLNSDAAPLLLAALAASATPLTTLHFELLDRCVEEDEQHLRLVGLMLLSSRHTLRTLRLYVHGPFARVIYPHLSFSTLSNLHCLLLHVGIIDTEDISVVAGLLSSISSRSLQFLQLDLDVRWKRGNLNVPTTWEVLNETLLLNVHLAKEIAISMIVVGDELYASGEKMFGFLPALKNMNIVSRWSDEHYEAFWNRL